MNTNDQVFLSYARSDGSVNISKLDAALLAQGFKTWYDKRDIDPTQDFTAEIEQAIEASSCVVACITPDVRRNDSFVRREIGYAMVLTKPVIVLRFADVPPPISIVNHTYIDFFQDWENAIRRLYALLKQPLGDFKLLPWQQNLEDPYRPYLDSLYKQIVYFLDKTVFSLLPEQSSTTFIPLHFEASLGVVASSETITSQALPTAFFDIAGIHPNADDRRFKNFHEAFKIHEGRLLLLGSPGTGKTTTLLAFARDAVAKRLEDPTQPLPIIAPIGVWDTEHQPLLSDWLTQIIPAFNGSIEEVLANGKALLLLDGLDELSNPQERFMIANALQENGAPSQAGVSLDPRIKFMNMIPQNNQIIITCRTSDYQALGEKSKLRGAVTLQPLSDEQMYEYLRELPELWNVLLLDDNLREVARTPLLLSLFAFAFAGLNNEATFLHNLGNSEIRSKIFEIYVRRRYEHEARKPHAELIFSLEVIYELLGWLAMENAGGGRSPFHPLKENIIRPFLPTETVTQEQIEEFFELATRLNFLIPLNDESSSYQFVHLLIRDYFACEYALQNLRDPAFYGNLFNFDNLFKPHPARILGTLRDNRAVEPLIEALQDDDWSIRLLSVQALENLNDKRAVEPLIGALHDQNVYVRRFVDTALGNLSDRRASEPLVNALRTEKDSENRFRISNSIAKLKGSSVIELLIGAMRDDDGEVRYYATDLLGELGDGRAVGPLIEALIDVDGQVRYAAAVSLGELNALGAIDPLIKVLINKSERTQVRETAADTLGKLGDPRAFDVLVNVLHDQKEEWEVRRVAARALGRLGDSRAFDVLVNVLHDQNEEQNVRSGAAYSLSQMNDPRVFNVLVRMVHTSRGIVRSNSIRALGNFGDRHAVELLIALLQNPNEQEQGSIALALGNLGDGRAVEPLINLLSNTNALVRESTVEALGRLGDKRAINPLINALHDEVWDVRNESAKVLKLFDTLEALKAVEEARVSGLLEEPKDPLEVYE